MLEVVIHAAVATTLVVAGVGKAGRREDFARTVAAYEIVGWRGSRAVAAGLPSLEIAVGAALVLPLAAPLAATVATLLFAAFAGALALNRLRGRTELACGCFRDEEPRPLTWATVGRPAALAVVAALPGTAVSPDLLAPLGRLAPLGPLASPSAPTVSGTVGATVAGAALAALLLAAGAARRAIAAPHRDAARVPHGYLSAARLIKESSR